MADNDEYSKGEIVMYQPDETVKLEVRLDNETVWLTQQQMAELFDKDRTVIGRHIRNIYAEQELEQNITCAKFAHKGSDGDQLYEYTVYNLDVIISVGYRVKSARGIKFRQWANKILKDYLLKGYAADSRYMSLEQKITEQGRQISDLQKKVDFFIRTSLPPVEGVFYDGQIFDAYLLIVKLIQQAKQSIVLIDNYVDETVLAMLGKRTQGTIATIYTKQITPDLQLAINRFNSQYPPIAVHLCRNAHDRFLIIDDTVYLFGASIKDAGKKLFAFIKMQETQASEIMNMIR
ncbi:MAG: virulence RhuM family protein [Bacteroidales bacterium]|nr:virulence RhuM family protein [Bacteroidales bacterium]